MFVAGPRVPDALYWAWIWTQGIVLALVAPMLAMAVASRDGRRALAALAIFVVSWATAVVGAGLWPGLGELAAVESGRFRALEVPIATIRAVDVGPGWSKGGLEVVLFPYRAAIGAMAALRAASFFGPDERAH